MAQFKPGMSEVNLYMQIRLTAAGALERLRYNFEPFGSDFGEIVRAGEYVFDSFSTCCNVSSCERA